MSILDALIAEALDDYVVWIVAGLLITALFTDRRAPGVDQRLRKTTVYVGLNLLLALIAGLLRVDDSPAWTAVHVSSQAFAAVAGVSMATTLVFGTLLPRLGLNPPRILGDVVGAGAMLFLLLGLASTAGFNLSGVIATSAVLTAVIGLALQDTLGNLVGGLALQIDKSIEVGDWIRLGDVVGRVADIRWRYTAIETRDWETLVVPNGQIVKNHVLVLGWRTGEPAQLRRTVTFQVDYRFPPRQVIAAVEEALRASPIPRVAERPAPHVLFFDFDPGFARYAVRYWLADLNFDDPVDSDVRVRVHHALMRAGIPPALPGATRVVVQATELRDELGRSERQDRFEAISRTELFVHLPEEDRRELADGLRVAPYGAGELIARQGTYDDGLFLLASGEVAVRVAAAGGFEREVNRLGPGSFFGEGAMMTGAPRNATVVAQSDVVCYRLERSVFESVLRRRPALAEEVAAVIARRRAELEDAREDLDLQQARGRRPVESEGVFVSRIRQLFGLDEN